MKIPNDTGAPWRLKKFVEYQHKVPPIHPVTLLAYAERHSLSPDELVILAWLISLTYCEITALFLFEHFDWTCPPRKLERFWEVNKPFLIFNSARRYAKNMDWFVPIIQDFSRLLDGAPYAWLRATAADNDGLRNYEALRKAVMSVRYTGRFASDLVLEMLLWYSRKKMIKVKLEEPEELDWSRGSNLTSGLLNVLYRDDEAEEFDRSGKLPATTPEALNEELRRVQRAVRLAYPKQEVSLPLIQTKLCSFRNLFKGTRYGGYHHDRQLLNLLEYERNYPGRALWKELREIRQEIFPASLLGEVGGWNGVRKERTKLWLREGHTGVEEI